MRRVSNLPNAGGVYVLRHLPSGRIYVGSTVRLRNRRNTHFGHLRTHRHRVPELQRAFDADGEAAFSFEVLERVDDEARLSEVRRGRKATAEHRAAISRARATRAWALLTPGGERLDVVNLAAFAAARNPSKGRLSLLMSGQIDSYRGWRRAEA
jgi:hypothetical protein